MSVRQDGSRPWIRTMLVLLLSAAVLVPFDASSADAKPLGHDELDDPLVLTPKVTTAGDEPDRWSADLRGLSAAEAQKTAAGMSSRLYGSFSSYPYELHQPLSFRTDFTQRTKLGFYVSAACRCGADLQISIGDTVVHRLDWPAEDETIKPGKLYYFTVPAGDQTVSFEVAHCTGPVVIDNYTYAASADDLGDDHPKVDLDETDPETIKDSRSDKNAVGSSGPNSHTMSQDEVHHQTPTTGKINEGRTAAPQTLELSVDQSAPLKGTRADTAGISIGKQNLARPEVMKSTHLAQYLKTLGPKGSILRIGGSQADQTQWSTQDEPLNTCAATWTVTPASIDALKTLVDRTGRKVIYGVNLKQHDPERAADEIAHVSDVLGDALDSVEIGNEPDLFYKGQAATDRFWTDFESYVDAIAERTPSVKIIGPTAAARPSTAFVHDFVDHQKAKDSADITALNLHRYSFSGCAGDTGTLLSAANLESQRSYADQLVAEAQDIGVTPLLAEANSASGGGCQDVSDNLGAALWTIDSTLAVSEHGLHGVYFHTSLGRCGDDRPDFTDYSSLCAKTDEDAAVAKEQIRAPFYGLLALDQIGAGQFLTITGTDDDSVRGYAIKDGDQLKVVLINVADPASAGDTDVRIDLGASYRSASSLALQTSSEDGLQAKTGITLGGGTVGTDGKVDGMKPDPVPVDDTSIEVTVGAGSAQIITLDAAGH